MLAFRLGFAPITWNNEDLADLGAFVAYTTVLDEIAAAGYLATELGRGRLEGPGLLDALRAIGFDGWLMVDQDSTWLAPLARARASRASLRSLGI